MMAALFWLATITVLAIPFVPAAIEWLWPSDGSPLALAGGPAGRGAHDVREFAVTLPQGEEKSDMQAHGTFTPLPANAGEGACAMYSGSLFLERVCTDRPLYVAQDFSAGPGSHMTELVCGGDVVIGPGSEVLGWAHADGDFQLGAHSVGLRRLSCGQVLRVGTGCCFERLQAREIVLGPPWRPEPQPQTARIDRSWAGLPDAQRASENFYRFRGSCDVPEASHCVGSAVVDGALSIGAGSLVEGSLKARRGVVIASGARIEGAVTCESEIQFLTAATALGPIVSETTVILAKGCRIGTAEAATTVSAPAVIIEAGAIVHGTVWARRTGVVWGGDRQM